MSKLFVITFKRPAMEIEKMTMNIDFAYDCEATGIPEVAKIRYKDALNKYDDVEMFECEDYEYVNFVKNDDFYTHFTRTGEHSMKPIESIQEDVEVSTENHTEQLYLKLEMTRTDENVDFNYNIHVDDIGQIIFTPSNSGCSFTDVNRVAGYDSTEDVVDGNTKTFVVSLDATMISDSDNFDWFYDIDEVGQAVITPSNDDTSFLTVSVNDSLNLVTPVNEDLEVGTEEYENRRDIVLTVISDLQNALSLAIDKAKRIEADFQAIGIHNADIDSYMIRYLENFIEDREGEVSCADFVRRIEEYESEGGNIEEAFENNSHNEIDRLDIIGKFMRGELPLFSDDGEPDPRLIRLHELDTTDKVKHEYYYDPESESIVYYEGR